MKKPGSAADPLWYKDAIVYELQVRAFLDGNGDGAGDFAGLIQKLDYLQDLGVTCLWLLPFFPSPLKDDGYDISDYRGVHPMFGTMDDFRAFLAAAHERGLQVMIEVVMNHTSDQHPWFQRARQAPAGSAERDFYVWSDTNEKYKDARIIFTDTEKSNWTWDPVAQAYYWHRFFSHQPDLNFDNPQVVEEVFEIVRYWLDMGVDALRLDAIPYLVERDGTTCENLPETHALIRRLRREIDDNYGSRMMLAEANQWPSDVRPYFGDGDECHMAFHFPLMPRIYMAVRQEDRLPVTDIIAQTPAIPDTCQWGLFLRNHDELTLEMVTSDERDYMYLAYSAEARMRINLGIRRRLAPLMDNNRSRIELLNSLLFSFPGTPILYYGDEIGMGDNVDLGDRNGVRTPMQWNRSRNAGFSAADPASLYSPVITDAVWGYEAVNVEAEQSDPSSLLSWMRNMIALRKLFRVFGRGGIEFLSPANCKVLAYLRRYDGEQVLCVANLSRFAQPVDLDLPDFEGTVPVEMLGYVEFPPIGPEPYRLTLGAYGFLWFQLQARTDGAAAAAGQTGAQMLAERAARSPVESHPLAEGCIQPIRIADWTVGPDAIPREALERIGQIGAADVVMSLLHSTNGAASMPLVATLEEALASVSGAGRAVVLSGDAVHKAEHAASGQAALWDAYRTVFKVSGKLGARACAIIASDLQTVTPQWVDRLLRPALEMGFDLVTPRYARGKLEGLLNRSLIAPLQRALYGKQIHNPMGPDLGLSGKLLERVLANGAVRPGETAHPVASLASAAVSGGLAICESYLGVRLQPPVDSADLSSLLVEVLEPVFVDMERNAALWQRIRGSQSVPAYGEPVGAPEETAAADARRYIESFQLGIRNLEDVWGLVLPPTALLELRKLGTLAAGRFRMADELWVSVVYDFALGHRLRTISRDHLLRSLTPIYLGWLASYALEVETAGAAEASERFEKLARAYEAGKPYLVSRWRWPDRFQP